MLCYNKLIFKKSTNVDKLNEILASKTDFSLVRGIDGHFQSLVHGHHAIGPSMCISFFHRQRRKVRRTLSFLRTVHINNNRCSRCTVNMLTEMLSISSGGARRKK